MFVLHLQIYPQFHKVATEKIYCRIDKINIGGLSVIDACGLSVPTIIRKFEQTF